MQQMIFIADLTACSTCFWHHCAHHQELESIIQVVAACRIWCLVFKLSVWCGAEGCVSGLWAGALNQDMCRLEEDFFQPAHISATNTARLLPEAVLIQFVSPDDDHDVLETCREL